MNLKIDPERTKFVTERGVRTGIYVRAQRGEGWESVDIAELDRDSLLVWLASRDDAPDGGKRWRENVVLILLGHER